MKEIKIGIEIGGTNIVWGYLNEKGESKIVSRLKTQDFLAFDDFFQHISGDIRVFLDEKNYLLKGVGIAAPNANREKGIIENAANLPWQGSIYIKEKFLKKFPVNIVLDNDANAAAIGEKTYGNAKDYHDFIMITLGTGLGSGIFSNNALLYGANTLAGELGHIIIHENSERNCGCGRKGCLETYCSAKGMQLTADELLGESKEKSILSEQNPITPLSIWEAAKKKDAVALQVYDKTAKSLALALANAVCVTNPQAIIIGGGIAQSGDYLFSPLKRYFSEYLLHIYHNTVEIKESNLSHKEAGVLGAIALLE